MRAPDKSGGDPASEVYAEDCLYDLDADPHERSNLARDSGLKDIRAGLAETLKRRMVEAGEQAPRICSAPETDS